MSSFEKINLRPMTAPRLLRLALALALLPFLASALAAEERPNVLWIVSDDLGVELGCYGEEHVSTPNLDRLAAEGIRYAQAFSSSPVCSSTRTAFITGMYQTSVGGFHHRTRKIEPLPEPVKPVTEYFREAGYHVSNSSAPPIEGEWKKKWGKFDYNFEFDAREMFDGPDWSNRDEGQPFFAQVQIFNPHRSFVKSGRSGEDLDLPPFYPDHPVIRADWANYLATIEVLDEKVGLVLDRLEAEGLADNTIVFFFGDHGRPHLRGKQWLYEAGLHVPLIVRNPLDEESAGTVVEDQLASLIDVAPTSLALAGLEVPGHMQGLDLFSPEAAAREELYAARDRCGDAFDRIRSVRTHRYKYIRNFHPDRSYSQMSGYKKLQYPALTVMAVMHEQGRLSGRQAEWFEDTRPAEEFYDLENDPHELHNLVGTPAYAEQMADLSASLDQWMEDTADGGAELEGDEAFLAGLVREKTLYYTRVMQRRGLDPELSDRAYLKWWKKELGVE